ncbi:MAG: hypothetical protein AABY22_20890, partial [Nanoarchaeota archaeon]
MTEEKDLMDLKEYNFSVSFLLVISIVINFYAIYSFAGDRISSDIKGFLMEEPNNVTEIIGSCRNMSLEDSVSCMNEYVKSFYKYTLTDDDVDLTLEELKERGGDCLDYSRLYAEMAKELGFDYDIIFL